MKVELEMTEHEWRIVRAVLITGAERLGPIFSEVMLKTAQQIGEQLPPEKSKNGE